MASSSSGWVSPQAAYKSFLLNNIGRVTQIESTLRTVSYLLPASFSSPARTEYVYSALNLLSFYHDSILPPAPHPSPHARYTRLWTSSNAIYKLVARALVVLKTVELAIEMRVSEKRRESTVVALESIKTLLRLLLLFLTRRRPTIYPPIAERDTIDPTLSHPSSSSSTSPSPPSSPLIQTTWKGTRTGRTRPTIASIRARTRAPNGSTPGVDAVVAKDPFLMGGTDGGKKEIEEFLQGRVRGLDDIRRPKELVVPLGGAWEVVGEIIHILRPLIYVMLLKKYGRRDPIPFFSSLAIEYATFKMFSLHIQKRRTTTPASEVEKGEKERRERQFWKYLFRGPVWDAWTKPHLQRISGALEGKPLLGLFSTYVDLYVPLIEEYYYYTS
ncbi:peroxisome membrane protein [Atractiella rhizophila]|nr:peroxisome membrane protein [Atractiella rhizophila]